MRIRWSHVFRSACQGDGQNGSPEKIIIGLFYLRVFERANEQNKKQKRSNEKLGRYF